jgi:membrane protease subunit (stomatin/prohibitin family)
MALLDVVQWDNQRGDIIHKFPEGAISLGAQLIVKEGQQAVFFREGKALDSFGPGRYTLKTGNIPLLEKLINLPFGGKSPFPAEVYYINMAEVPNLKWGTKQPIQFLDPIYQIAIPLRAFGSYSIRVQDPKGLLIMAIGTWQAFTTDAIGAALRDMVILPKLQDLLTETMLKQNISILKVAAYYEELGVAGRTKMGDEFASFGLELVRFAVESVNFPEEDESVKRLKKALADKAEINIIGSEDYKMKRTFDTMEKAAGGNGMAGGMMGAGMGVGMGQMMGQMMGAAMGTQGNQAGSRACPHCNAANPANAKFCASCGKEMAAGIPCPKCNAIVPQGAKFCPSCGQNMQVGTCPKCNAQVAVGAKFCPSCGEKLA